MTTETATITEAEFEAACRDHDCTAAMSDDFSVQQRYREESRELKRMAVELGLDLGIEIYNRVIDERVGPLHADMFKWQKS